MTTVWLRAKICRIVSYSQRCELRHDLFFFILHIYFQTIQYRFIILMSFFIIYLFIQLVSLYVSYIKVFNFIFIWTKKKLYNLGTEYNNFLFMKSAMIKVERRDWIHKNGKYIDWHLCPTRLSEDGMMFKWAFCL